MLKENVINPKALRAARKRRNMTQEKLAEAVRCTKDTVSRWERGTSRQVRPRLRDSLCTALGINWKDLSGMVDEKSSELFSEPGKTKVTINRSLRNSLQLVAERYGISLHDVINLAPLLLVIVAEQSLIWRRKRLVEIESTLNEMEERLTNFSDRLGETIAILGTDAEGSFLEEDESLKKRDVFGRSISSSNVLWDPVGDFEDPHGPFIDFIRELTKGLPKEAVDNISSFNGKMIDDYIIATDTIKNSIGLSFDEEKDLEFLWLIFGDTSIDLRQCIRVRQERDESGYRQWLLEQVRKANENITVLG